MKTETKTSRSRAVVGKHQLFHNGKPVSVWQLMSWMAWNPSKLKAKRDKIIAVLFRNLGNPLTEKEIARKAGLENYAVGQSIRDCDRTYIMGRNVLNLQRVKVKECGKMRPAYFIAREGA